MRPSELAEMIKPFVLKWIGEARGLSGRGAPSNAPLVTVEADARLSGERVLAEGTGIEIADGGADSTVTVGLGDTAVTPGEYGDGLHSAQITVDQQGRITSAAEVVITAGGGGGVTHHGDLDGLEDDDHPQYAKDEDAIMAVRRSWFLAGDGGSGESSDVAVDSLIAAHAVPPLHLWSTCNCLLSTAVGGVTYYNVGWWTGADETLSSIGNRLRDKTGATLSVYDTATSAWKTIQRVGAIWIGSTTFTVESGMLMYIIVGTNQYLSIPWIVVNPLYSIFQVAASNFIAYSGGSYYAGVSGSFTTTDGKTITVKNGIVTAIV